MENISNRLEEILQKSTEVLEAMTDLSVKVSKLSALPPIVQKLNAILKAADFTLLEAGSLIGGQGQTVSELAYKNAEGERVFIITHQAAKGAI